MKHASDLQAVCFSDATIAELHALVHRSAAQSAAPSTERLARLQALAASDRDFATWCQSAAPRANCTRGVDGTQHNHDVHVQCPQAIPAPVDWAALAERLATLLIRHPSWCRGEDAASNRSSQLLLDTAFLAVRLQGLQNSFAAELQHQKAKAIYNFAYGLSHELNNPLANIASRAGVLLSDESAPHKRALLEAIIDNAMRGCDMLGDLMLVARPPMLESQNVSLADLLQKLQKKAQSYTRLCGVELRLDLGENHAATLLADPVSLTEAIWCLLRNALEALPDGGNVVITLQRLEALWRIEIRDDGMGLSATALENCFDPYFSGREAGRGLGLGLAKAKRIVELHQGELSIANAPGGGCSATMTLSGTATLSSG